MGASRTRSWEILLSRPAALFGLIAAWFTLDTFVLGPASTVEAHDWADFAVPWYLWKAAEPFADRGALWLAASSCGVDRLSQCLTNWNFNALLFVFLPGWLANAAAAFGPCFLAGYFTWRLARDDFSMGELPSAFAGIMAMSTIPQTLYFQGGFALWPAALWTLERLAGMPARKALPAAAAAGLAYASFSSAATTLPFCMSGTVAWFILVRPKASLGFWLRLGAFAATASLPHLKVIWALAANAPFSHRLARLPQGPAPKLADVGLDVLKRLAQHAFFLGIFLWGWFSSSRTSQTGRKAMARLAAGFLLTIIGVAILCFLQTALTRELGPLAGFQFNRYNQLIPLMTALLGAWGLERLGSPRILFLAVILSLACASLFEKARNLKTWFYAGSYAANFESPVLRDLAQMIGPEPSRVASFIHGLHPGYAQAYGLETADGYAALYPASYHRFWAAVISPLLEDKPAFRYYLADGNRQYLYFDRAEDWPEGIPFSRFYRLDLLSLANTRFIVSRHPLIHPDLVLLRGAPSWQGMERRERAMRRLRENIAGKSDFHVYENRGCLPRAFLAGKVRGFAAEKELWPALSAASAAELGNTVFLTETDAQAAGPVGFKKGSARWLPRSADRIALETEADGPAVLVVSNSFSPFWQCRVDGRPTPILRAYGTFWGVRLDAGTHRVSFTYEPPYR